MTEEEKIIAHRLSCCRFQVASFDKKFVRQLDNWHNRKMTEKGKSLMIKFFHKYRRQIKDYKELCYKLKILTTTKINQL